MNVTIQQQVSPVFAERRRTADRVFRGALIFNGALTLFWLIVFLTKSGDFKHRAFRCADRHRPGSEWLAGWPER